jgi:hypothetical protein
MKQHLMEIDNSLTYMHFGKMTYFYDIYYIYEPKKLALRYTTSEPTHITKNIDVIIVDASF